MMYNSINFDMELEIQMNADAWCDYLDKAKANGDNRSEREFQKAFIAAVNEAFQNTEFAKSLKASEDIFHVGNIECYEDIEGEHWYPSHVWEHKNKKGGRK